MSDLVRDLLGDLARLITVADTEGDRGSVCLREKSARNEVHRPFTDDEPESLQIVVAETKDLAGVDVLMRHASKLDR